jgi:hypothetical protein
VDLGGPAGMSRATIYRKIHEYGIYTSVEQASHGRLGVVSRPAIPPP